MVQGLRAVMFASLGFAFLSLTGCPPPAVTKPEVSSAQARASQVGAPQAGAPKDKRMPVAREAAAPRTSLEALRAGRPPAEGALKEIYFDFDRYDIRADARPVLQANADWLRKNPAMRVQIEGHADERGTTEYNLALGAKRAQAAKDYLATLGVGAGSLSTISYGEEVPVCKEKTEECWQKNRRGRFVVIAPKPAS